MSGRGVAALSTSQKIDPAGPPFAAGSARNGTSLDGTGRIVLGNDAGGVSAILLSNREIPLDTFSIMFVDNVAGASLGVQPTDAPNSFLFGLRFIDTNLALDITLGIDPAFGLALQGSGTGVCNFSYVPGPPAAFGFGDGAIIGGNAVVNINMDQTSVGLQVNVNSDPTFINLIQLFNGNAGSWGANVQFGTDGTLAFLYMGIFGPGYGDAFMQNSTGMVTDPAPATQWMNFANRSLNGAGYRWFHQIGLGAPTQTMEFLNPGRLGIRVTGPTAALHLPAGAAAASGAPFKYTAGVNLAAVENGAKEFDGTNEFVSAGGVRYTLAKTLTATAALDFPNTAAQTSSDLTIAVTGAALGDVVALGVPNGAVNANSCHTAWVSAANTVTVRFNNYSAAAIDPASGTFRVSVIKY